MSEPRVATFAESGVIIAGGTGQVGVAIARSFLAAGVTRLGLIGRNGIRGAAAVSTLLAEFPGTQVSFRSADLNDVEGATAVVADLEADLGGIDIVVNGTTGAYTPHLLHDTDPFEIPGILSAQMLGSINVSRAALPYLRAAGGGAIVNIASDAAKYPTPGESIIGAAMAAIVMFSRTLAMEAKRDGIRVNAVTPSLINNSGGYDRVMNDEFSGKLFAKATKLAALGVAEPQDIADLVVFLCSPEARRITGQVVSPNGGISS